MTQAVWIPTSYHPLPQNPTLCLLNLRDYWSIKPWFHTAYLNKGDSSQFNVIRKIMKFYPLARLHGWLTKDNGNEEIDRE